MDPLKEMLRPLFEEKESREKERNENKEGNKFKD